MTSMTPFEFKSIIYFNLYQGSSLWAVWLTLQLTSQALTCYLFFPLESGKGWNKWTVGFFALFYRVQ